MRRCSLNRLSRCALILLAALTPGCDETLTAPTPWDGQVRVTGVVTAFQTKAPVAGALVNMGGNTTTTNASGAYQLTVAPAAHLVVINDDPIGVVTLKDRTYRGDFYTERTGCVARYGTLVDSATRQPIAGATVSVGGRNGTTDKAGWYDVSLGCTAPCIGFNTTFLYISHPNYVDGRFVAGRGVCGVQRYDYELVRK
jgi:hypothetical protein